MEADHSVPVLERAIAEHQVDDRGHVDSVELAQLVSKRRQLRRRFGASVLLLVLRANPGQAALRLLVGLGTFPEDVGLETRNVAGHPLGQEREDGAVHRRFASRRLPQLTKLLHQQLAQRSGFLLAKGVVLSQLVGQRTQIVDVEGDRLVLREDGERRTGTRGVPYTQLVEDVGICGGEVSQRVITQQQTLEHGLVDDPAGALLIGADRVHAGVVDGRRECLVIDTVEVDVRTTGWIRLLVEGHDYEAEGSLSHRWPPVNKSGASPAPSGHTQLRDTLACSCRTALTARDRRSHRPSDVNRRDRQPGGKAILQVRPPNGRDSGPLGYRTKRPRRPPLNPLQLETHGADRRNGSC